MTFYCHHCNREAYATPNPTRLFHPVRGWMPACNHCVRNHNETQ